jgi:hypothetical protein
MESRVEINAKHLDTFIDQCHELYVLANEYNIEVNLKKCSDQRSVGIRKCTNSLIRSIRFKMKSLNRELINIELELSK